ncbi:hypothetical protein [Methyloglobulus morosus]|nr:hypothetical protein [Methyloglobulus morosus]
MMKRDTLLRSLTLIAVALGSVEALAYSDDKEKEICRHPKVQEFTLPEYGDANKKEVAPEAEFTFVVSGWASPKKFKLDGKGIDIPFAVQSTETYHKVKAKLPAALTGHLVRINARIPAVLGCYSTVGWLIKVADKAAPVEAPKPAETIAPTSSATGAASAVQNAARSSSNATQAPEKVEPVQNIQDVK